MKIGMILAAALSATTQVAGYPEGFTTEAKLALTKVCDNGAAKVEIYEGPHEGASSVGPYQWIFVSKDGVIRFWLWVPNPNSMSPVVINYVKTSDGFTEISAKERDAILEKEMPTLWAEAVGERTDCVTTKIPHE